MPFGSESDPITYNTVIKPHKHKFSAKHTLTDAEHLKIYDRTHFRAGLDSNLLLSGQLQQIGCMEWIMYKPTWEAFYNTLLEKHLQSLGVNTVVVSGCNFPNCHRTTIYEASERDFKTILVNDATSMVYDIGLSELKNIGVSIKYYRFRTIGKERYDKIHTLRII